MKITVEIPIDPRQKYCVDKKTGEECPHVMGTGWNEYLCNLFFCGLETSPTGSGYSIRCKQCKEAGKNVKDIYLKTGINNSPEGIPKI